jgi:bifunctional non-homologous end joining protein LigD
LQSITSEQAISFIRPSIAVTAAVPPRGVGWLHEIMIDGIRVQLHKSGGRVIIYGSDGQDLTAHLPDLRQNLLSLPVRSAILDAVVVARNGNIKLGFDAFLAKAHTRCCCWCFDLLECDGVDLRARKLVERKARLQELISDDHLFRYCSEIRDPAKALAVSERIGCAGTVSKRADQPYRSGRNPDWVQVTSGAPRMPVVVAREATLKPRMTSARRLAPRRSTP